MNTLILMAGSDVAFEDAGYLYPKNLVEIDGLPLAQRVIEKLSHFSEPDHKFICAVREEENKRFYIADVIRLLVPNAIIIEVKGSTAGAACTALLAAEYINNDEPLLVTSGDQIIAEDITAIINSFKTKGLDGGMPVFESVHPRWSYVKCSEDGLVIEASEKRPISNLATAGLYYFAKGSNFVNATMEMIKKDDHVNGNFYICPIYNQMILNQAKIGVCKIPKSNYFKLAGVQEVQAYSEYLHSYSLSTQRNAKYA